MSPSPWLTRHFRLAVLMVLLIFLLAAAGCVAAEVSPAVDGSAAAPAQETPTVSASTEISDEPENSAVETTPSVTSTMPPTSLSPTPLAPFPSPTPTPTPCPQDFCVYPDSFLFSRPIAADGNGSVDHSYRYGSTQGGRRDPHHGVEFLNGSGTSVLAAADGVVRVAGDDTETLYGPYPNFYGNVVIIEHEVPDDKLKKFRCAQGAVFTLYAHLSEVLVVEGAFVSIGDEIGLVGMTGSATGSHLHFEVRMGENTYESVRNPELWLIPEDDPDSGQMGALAGYIVDQYGNSIAVENVVIQHLPEGPEGPSGKEFYTHSYEEENLRGQPPWGDSFAINDLPAGWYRVSFPHHGLRRYLVQVFPGQLTVLDVNVDG